jgi:hypothetical protein
MANETSLWCHDVRWKIAVFEVVVIITKTSRASEAEMRKNRQAEDPRLATVLWW